MKNYKLTFILIITLTTLLSTISIAQNNLDSIYKGNFNWEYIDTINKSKDEIYSLNKIFISKIFNEPDNVIKIDDKDGGIIIVTGKITINGIDGLMISGSSKYYYDFSMSLYHKDNKYRIVINDVSFDKFVFNNTIYHNPAVQPFENGNYPNFVSKFKGDKLKLDKMMNELKFKLNAIVLLYSNQIKKLAIQKDDW